MKEQRSQQLIHLSRARQELTLAKSLGEVKDIRDRAEALRAYAKQACYGLEVQNDCAEIKLRAERRAGELLAEMEKHPPGPDRFDRQTDLPPRLIDYGITKFQSHRWQAIASIPADRFEKFITETKERREELTSAAAYRLARKPEPIQEIELPRGKYRTIVIDPPWPMEKITRTPFESPYLDYPVMEIDEIKAFPVRDLTAEDCHVYLWTTHRFLPVAFDILEEWGVRYHCLLTWIKNAGFTPYSWMFSTEHCLFGWVGKLSLLKMGQRVDFYATVREHSRKPKEFYDIVRAVSPEPRIDLFSRERHEGFEQWGAEVERFVD